MDSQSRLLGQQLSLFIIPFIIIIRWITGIPFSLLFDPFESVALYLADLSRFSRRGDWYLVGYTPASPRDHFRPVSDLPTLFQCCLMFLMIFRCFVEFLFDFRHLPFMFPTILSFFRRFAAALQHRYCYILHPIVDDRVLLFPLFGLFSVWFRACPEPL